MFFLKIKKIILLLKVIKLKYEKKKYLIYSEGETNFNIENKYKIKFKNIFYDRNKKIIYGNEKTIN